MGKNNLNRIFILPILCIVKVAFSAESDPTAPDYLREKYAVTSQKTMKPIHADFEVRMILDSSNKKSAVINSDLVSEGDTISGAKVEKILANSVVLVKSGNRIELQLIKGIR